MTSGRRLRSLDGLRGVAAFAVLIHHALLTWNPWLRTVGNSSVAMAPVHSLLDGGIAVYTFFILSGFVLTWNRERGWLAYYAKRLPRLYVPSIAAVGFAALLAATFRWPPDPTNWWLTAHSGALNAPTVLHEVLLAPGDTFLNGPLWSLAWEVAFSLTLPLYVLAAARLRRAPVVQIVALLAVVAVGSRTGYDAVTFMPMFGIGVVLARHRDSFTRAGGWIGAVVALAAGSIIQLAHTPGLFAVGFACEAAAAAWLVIAAWRWDGLRLVLERRPMQWLGSRSFALYLTHEPLVVTFGGRMHPFAARLLPMIVLSLVVAEVFFRLVERPAHRVARRLGRMAETRSALVVAVQRDDGARCEVA